MEWKRNSTTPAFHKEKSLTVLLLLLLRGPLGSLDENDNSYEKESRRSAADCRRKEIGKHACNATAPQISNKTIFLSFLGSGALLGMHSQIVETSVCLLLRVSLLRHCTIVDISSRDFVQALPQLAAGLLENVASNQ